MPEITQGVILDSFKFKETSQICRIFTLQHGLLSVLVNGVRSKNSSISQAYLQPLSQIEFSLYFKERAGLLRISNISLIQGAVSLEPDIRKYAISLFVSEIVLRTTKEKEVDSRLFSLLSYVIHCLKAEVDFKDLHVFFLFQYAELLGFSLKSYDISQDLHVTRQGELRNVELLTILSTMPEYGRLGINKTERADFLRFLLRFYESNAELPKIRALDILEEVFS